MGERRLSLLMVAVWARKGGAERLISQLLERLRSEFDVALALLRRLPPDERTLSWDGLEVGVREVLFGDWDIVHSHLFLPGALVWLRRIWDGGFRWVHTVHYHDYADLRLGALKRWIDHHLVLPGADALVAVSPEVRDDLLSRFPHVELIENAIPLPAPVSRPDRKPGEGPEGPVIGTVAMLRPEKGLDDLVRCAAILAPRHRGLRVLIAGEGPERSRLEARIGELGLDGTVQLMGFIDDLDEFYSSIDVYVQPSRTEAAGLAALEAMRFELPIVAAGVGHLPELLGGGKFGVIVERAEEFPDELASVLDEVLEDPSSVRRRSSQGLRHWRQQLDPETMARRYRDLYRRLRPPRG